MRVVVLYCGIVGLMRGRISIGFKTKTVVDDHLNQQDLIILHVYN